eukprot:6035027-Amphidinium_carterae.1
MRIEDHPDGLHLHQRSYTTELLKKFGYSHGTRTRTTTAAPERFGTVPAVPPDQSNPEHARKVQHGQQ